MLQTNGPVRVNALTGFFHSWRTEPPAICLGSPLLVTALLIYFRLLGRLARSCGMEG